MMIKEFIRDELLLPRMKRTGVLVVYDHERRYRDLCLELASEKRLVIDAGESSIESREAALAALQKLAEPNTKLEGLLVYVPAKRPESDQQRTVDPFALYEACGSVFPADDGDEFLSICLKAKPDHATEIRRIFDETKSPSFAVIDAVGGGMNWPQLRATLKAESARDILLALLVPTDDQLKALKEQDGWIQEARDLLHASLGSALKTKAKSWSPISEELWRFLLFSEFVFDLPGKLPASLDNVPRAPIEAKVQVEYLCEQLRGHDRTRPHYIEQAEEVEKTLRLIEACREIDDLGVKDTFPFEERTFLRRAIEGLSKDDLDQTRRLLDRHKHSVWRNKGESQAQWELIQSALNLIEACDLGESLLPENSRTQAALLDYYTGSLREVDRLQREFEQAAGGLLDPYGLMDDVINQARAASRSLTQKVQTVFMKHIETAGWPPAGRLANADVYDRFVG
ncbi:MAG: PglZ domain-containing protein, partial [Acidobacteria bacterium]|nr:PglZ domain-containing protein [Acidobacteriota bacterium]